MDRRRCCRPRNGLKQRAWHNRRESLEQNIFFEAPPAPRRGKKFFVALTIAVVLLAWSFHGAKIRPGELIEGIPQIGQTLARMLPPDFSKITEAKNYFFPENLSWTRTAVAGAVGRGRCAGCDNVGGTIPFRRPWWGRRWKPSRWRWPERFLALLVAFPLGFLAARNTTPHPVVYHSVRAGAESRADDSRSRAWACCFVAAVGLGAFAGTMALAIHTATVLGKLLIRIGGEHRRGRRRSDPRHRCRLRSDSFLSPCLPQILPDLISFTLYRLETNIRAASVLGLIGAGGIGYLMNTSFRTFQYQEAAAIVLVLIALVMLVDYLELPVCAIWSCNRLE